MALTDKQEMFCREYLIDLNATQAAIRAGYSVKTANRTASENLSKPDIQNRIAELKNKRNEDVGINAAYVLQRLVEIDQMDVADILNDDGSLKAVSQWPRCWRITLQGIDLASTIRNFDEETEETILKKIKWPDKVKNLELLGKHVDVQAFREQVKTNHTVDSLSDLMDELSGGA
ncbi:terminase small subunit [Cronobacter sakazakii]|uniref:terminase small subunit n=1 Tax=Cronobacter phage phiES15 TaxID=1168280 RepID=UPI00025F67CE|nr:MULTISPECIES: terminase small subunit [Cronobacter]YP_006590033.1 terminase small subunit [Cronobacter phage phiES15]AFH14950.1 terminase small subunit [Cronobacter phage phiES15]AFJ98458.1 phage terminase small subunit [Cronobacter sakazakii ES15]EJT7705351.1 terminase small subunit [Cronobacter sakazakii]ELY2518348.1 terminase small subunit [Cronobacter sakazakii]ELY3704871.1 terminase small subunit [Cronobacter sakazakii]